LHLTNRILYYFMLFFMTVGAFRLASRLRQKESPKEYLTLATGNYILLAACIVIPFFSEQLGTQRIFHISAIVLAPFCILGAEATFNALSRLARSITRLDFHSTTKMVISPILALFFLFNSGFIFEVAHDPLVQSPPLSLSAIEDPERYVSLEQEIMFRYISPTEQEVFSARWLAEHGESRQDVYATPFSIVVPALLAYGLIPEYRTIPILPPSSKQTIKAGYVYLGYINVVFGYGLTSHFYLSEHTHKNEYWHVSQIYPVLDKSVKVYTNGSSEIYWLP